MWALPEELRARCLPELRRWAAQRYGLAQAMRFPRLQSWTLYRKPLAASAALAR